VLLPAHAGGRVDRPGSPAPRRPLRRLRAGWALAPARSPGSPASELLCSPSPWRGVGAAGPRRGMYSAGSHLGAVSRLSPRGRRGEEGWKGGGFVAGRLNFSRLSRRRPPGSARGPHARVQKTCRRQAKSLPVCRCAEERCRLFDSRCGPGAEGVAHGPFGYKRGAVLWSYALVSARSSFALCFFSICIAVVWISPRSRGRALRGAATGGPGRALARRAGGGKGRGGRRLYSLPQAFLAARVVAGRGRAMHLLAP